MHRRGGGREEWRVEKKKKSGRKVKCQRRCVHLTQRWKRGKIAQTFERNKIYRKKEGSVSE